MSSRPTSLACWESSRQPDDLKTDMITQEDKPQPTKPDRLFAGCFPEGIVYADRNREHAGDYLRLAFMPYRTTRVEWEPGVRVPPDLRAYIKADVAHMRSMAMRGEMLRITTSGQMTSLGVQDGEAKP